jgi:hypothetical protein
MEIDDFLIKTAQHLATQRERCVNNGGSCVYENEQGNHCALGVHLPSDLCHELDANGYSAGTLFRLADKDDPPSKARRFVEAFYKIPALLLSDVQGIHDQTQSRTAADRESMMRRLSRLATEYKAERAHDAICAIEVAEF